MRCSQITLTTITEESQATYNKNSISWLIRLTTYQVSMSQIALSLNIPTDIVELGEAVIVIKNKNSSGEDGLPAKIFRNMSKVALQTLAHAINSLWQSGTFAPMSESSKVHSYS